MELTATQAAQALGIRYRHFRELLNTEDGVPHLEKGGPGKKWKFELGPLNRWWLERELKKSPHQAGRMLTLNDAREAKLSAEAQMAQLELGRMQDELVPISSVRPMLGQALTAVRGRLLAIPAKAAPVIRPDDPNMAREFLDKMIREVLEELSDGAIDLEISNQADSDSEAGAGDQQLHSPVSEAAAETIPF